jgi:sulfoxide reductase catalytic subunit YedY
MLIRTRDNGFIHPVSSEITPRSAYAGRREMMKLLAGGAAGAALAAWAGREALAQTVSGLASWQRWRVANRQWLAPW